MSTDAPHPSDPAHREYMRKRFEGHAQMLHLFELADAIKEVRRRGGKWKPVADTIEWAYDEIVRLRALTSEGSNP